jgi:DNA-binding NarL/FixJ family response regulator
MSDRRIVFRASPALAAWLAHYTPEGSTIDGTARTMLTERMEADFVPDAQYQLRPWTPEEDAAALNDGMTLREIAAELGRTLTAVKSRRYRLRKAEKW